MGEFGQGWPRAFREGIFNELGADGNGHPAGMDDFSLQHWMQVIDAGAIAVLQAMRAMSLLEDQISRAIGGDDELAVKAEAVQHFVADEPAHAAIAQLCQSRRTDVAQEMVQSLMH